MASALVLVLAGCGALVADLTVQADVDGLRDAVQDRFGGDLTALVNNAGATIPLPLDDLDGATPVLHPGTVGTGLDVDASVEALAPGWPLGEDPVALVTGEAQPTRSERQSRVEAIGVFMISPVGRRPP